MKKTYRIIGLMSGTSMDGIDLSLADYTVDSNSWSYDLIYTHCYSYESALLKQLENARKLSAENLLELDKILGLHFANTINHFIHACSLPKDTIHAIASHGHTVHHQPDKGFTCQIGCGERIAFHTGIPVVNDLRQKDVVAGGQGAPLVPIGDLLLFSKQADSFLNIGGFCNVCIPGKKTVAFDICPGNLPLNEVSKRLGHSFDHEGQLARTGTIIPALFEQLGFLDFYQKTPPKSLGTEWLDEFFYPLLKTTYEPRDILRTLVEHEATEIVKVLKRHQCLQVMITGGGARNIFLIERIAALFKGRVLIPDESIIDFKEALIFGFLAALYFEKTPNCIPDVTGARTAVCGGVLHLP